MDITGPLHLTKRQLEELRMGIYSAKNFDDLRAALMKWADDRLADKPSREPAKIN